MRFPLMRNNFSKEDLSAVIDHLLTDDPKLTHGPQVAEFEREWSEWLGVKYSVFVNSGASANLISMAILRNKYPDGGEVIVPALTWVSDIASVIQNGFKPVFVDIDPDTLSMDTDEVLKKVTQHTRAVFITHAQGFNGLTERLISFLNDKKIHLIEDVCESHGASFKNNKLGSFGWISNFSFYYAHHMSTIEGGMICTNDVDVYHASRMFRSHGMLRECGSEIYKKEIISSNPELNPDFIFLYSAYNCRNTEIGGILGRSQLKRLDANNIRRTENFLRFLDELNEQTFKIDFNTIGSSNYAFNLVQKDPDSEFAKKLMDKMKLEGIEFRRGSAGGGNQLRQPYLKGVVGEREYLQYPQTEHIHFYGYYIGNFPDLPIEDVVEIARILNSV